MSMERSQRAAAGFALAGVGHVTFAGLFIPFDTFGAVGTAIAAVGLLVAAAGTARLHLDEGLELQAGGLLVAAAAYVALVLWAYSSPGLYQTGFLLICVGLLQAAWVALLWSLDETRRGAARSAGLRLGAWLGAAGSAWFLALNLTDQFLLFAGGSVVSLAGFLLVARDLRGVDPAHRQHRLAARRQAPSPGGLK